MQGYNAVTEESLLRLRLSCCGHHLEGSSVLCLTPDEPVVPIQPEASWLCFQKQPFAHRVPFILLAADLSTKCNSAEQILVLYCSTCKYHVDTHGCTLAFISRAICPPSVSATQPLLPDCLYFPLEWHISTSFIIKENSFHI